eukprot:1140759-Pelagomonas_calceolata.AAC.4
MHTHTTASGEVTWVKRNMEKYHATAAAKGVKIVHCCGYDSIPSGVLCPLAIRHAWAFARPAFAAKHTGCTCQCKFLRCNPDSLEKLQWPQRHKNGLKNSLNGLNGLKT